MTRKNENLFAGALSRRLYPNTQIHPKQLAHALAPDPSPETVGNVLRSLYNHAAGASAPGAEAAARYVAFFVAHGDYAFVAEVYPGAAPLVRKARAQDAALAELERAAPPSCAARVRGAA